MRTAPSTARTSFSTPPSQAPDLQPPVRAAVVLLGRGPLVRQHGEQPDRAGAAGQGGRKLIGVRAEEGDERRVAIVELDGARGGGEGEEPQDQTETRERQLVPQCMRTLLRWSAWRVRRYLEGVRIAWRGPVAARRHGTATRPSREASGLRVEDSASWSCRRSRARLTTVRGA